jgi:hypothetical protein
LGGSNLSADRSPLAGFAGASTAGPAQRPETDTTDAGPSGDTLSIPDLASDFAVRRQDLDFEEAGSCCCYGRNNAVLDVVKQRARVTISDARTSEVLAEKVFDPPKTCPTLKDVSGIEPMVALSVPASVIEAWANQRVRELQKRRSPSSLPKN